MNKSSYEITFTFHDVSVKELNDLYQQVRAGVNPELFSVTVIDGVGGRHNLQSNTGIAPDGSMCKVCNLINCTECSLYKE